VGMERKNDNNEGKRVEKSLRVSLDEILRKPRKKGRVVSKIEL
jgi:hypothetical protein